MSQRKIRNAQIADEAADWAVKLDAGKLTPNDSSLFADWLVESPRHIEEFLMADTILNAFGHIDTSAHMFGPEDLAKLSSAEVISISGKVLDKPIHIQSPIIGNDANNKSIPWLRIAAVIVVFFALSISGIVPDFNRSGSPSNQLAQIETSGFSTQKGEQRKMVLEDGSIIHVNTQSEVSIHFDDNVRVVKLLRGEALFDVVHDPERPFQVITDDMTVEAIGTVFNIYNSEKQTSISVIDGIVAVETKTDFIENMDQPNASEKNIGRMNDGRLLLKAGQKANVIPDVKMVEVSPVNVETISSWSTGQLVFEGEKFSDIVKEFNRYNNKNIVIKGDKLAEKEISGVFDSNDPDSLIGFIELVENVHVDRTQPDFIVLSLRE